jgi:phage FluMu protein Com
MPKYQCPECEAVLRRAEAVAPGKKIRCPKCEAVFPANPLPEEEPAPAAAKGAEGYAVAGAAAPPKPPVEEEENSNPYTVIRETGKDNKPEIYLGSLRDRFAKSKIGPAMYKTVIPSNWLLRLGLFSCVGAVFYFIFALFPIIFCEATPLRPFIRPRVNLMIHATCVFTFGAIMCTGAAKMHDLTSYTWAIIGSIMALIIYIPTGIFLALLLLLIFGPLGLLLAVLDFGLSCVGLWCLIILMNKQVREGFRERAEEIEAGVP